MRDSPAYGRAVTIVLLLIVAASGSCASSAFVVNNDVSDNMASADPPEMWIFGILGSPHLGQQMNAKGVRAIVDLNLFTRANIDKLLAVYESREMGLCITLRWKDPEREREELLPAPDVVDAKLDLLMEVLASDQARGLGDRLWIQFFNEVTGGPGVIRSEAQADLLFAFATRAATRIREEAPHVKIAGPALTGIEVLQKDPATLSALGRKRRAGLTRCLEWSIENADAVDIHLHAVDGEWTRSMLRVVRDALDAIPGGSDMDLVTWEWSCARQPNRDDPAVVRAALDEIWAAMTEFDVKIAAYACYYPPAGLGDIYQWANVVDHEGKKNEPVYGFLVEVAGQQSGHADNNDDDDK